MEKIKRQTTFTKIALGLGILFLIYGFISRFLPIYFFWESLTIGWILILIGLIGVLINGIKIRKRNNKKTLINKIGIGFISFTIFIQTILMITFPISDAYKVSTNYLKNDKKLINEIGDIKGFGIPATGSISKKMDMNGETGEASLNLIVKGTKKYKTINIYSRKDYDSEWRVIRTD